eukprot:469047-Pelagomonas_calceolata.AAC.3
MAGLMHLVRSCPPSSALGQVSPLHIPCHQAIATAAKAQEDLKILKNRMADTRAAKEDLQRELDMAQYEATIVADEYREVCNGPANRVRVILDTQALTLNA